MGVTHRQREIRDRTIDALPNVPLGDPFVAFADGLARLEVRIAKLEALVTQISREVSLLAAYLAAPLRETVTHNASPVTPVTTVTPDRNDVTEPVTPRDARNAERQRRYRERKKASA